MTKFSLNSNFDSGSIDIIDAADPQNIELNIKKDNASDFFQWFHFSLNGDVGETYKIRIKNAGKSSYNKGWIDYHVCTSYNRQDWFRTTSNFIDGELIFEITLNESTVYFAYFTPYSQDRHLDLLAWAQGDSRCEAEHLGETIDGRAMTLLKIGNTESARHKVWVIARQHPGETMVE